MKIGDIVRFNEGSGIHMAGKVFLVLESEYMTDSGGYAYNGIHLKNWDIDGCIPHIPYPWKYDFSKHEMSIWNQWRSEKEYEVITNISLEIVPINR